MANPSVKLELPEYSGDRSKWDQWWYSFGGFMGGYGCNELVVGLVENKVRIGTQNRLRLTGDIEYKPLTSLIDDDVGNLLEKFPSILGVLKSKLKGDANSVARAVTQQELIPVLKALLKVYNPQTTANRNSAIQQGVSDHWDGGSELATFFGEKEALVNERLKGGITKDELLGLFTVGCLTPEYKKLAVPLQSNTTNPAAYEDLKSLCLEFYNSQKSNKKEEDEHVLSVSGKQKRAVLKFLSGGYQWQKGKGKGKKGKGKGKGKGQGWNAWKAPGNVCHRCKQPGHYARDCKAASPA